MVRVKGSLTATAHVTAHVTVIGQKRRHLQCTLYKVYYYLKKGKATNICKSNTLFICLMYNVYYTLYLYTIIIYIIQSDLYYPRYLGVVNFGFENRE